jgi:pSer/pThr/pTyr-binding forkhead associated (FHA) protein
VRGGESAAPAAQGPASVKLDGRAFIVLGRSGDADVKLEGKFCSRKHAIIGYDPARGHVYVEDLGSAHGTYVNEMRIDRATKTRLRQNDAIWFGSAEGEPRYFVHAVFSKKRTR